MKYSTFIYDFQDPRFLNVASDERWLMRLVDSQTKKPMRMVAEPFVDSFRREFNTATVSKLRRGESDFMQAHP